MPHCRCGPRSFSAAIDEDDDLSGLLAELEDAASVYKGGQEQDEVVRAWVSALSAMRVYLNRKKVSPAAAYLFMDLNAALIDVLQGNQPVQLKTRTKRSRPPQPSMHRIQWGVAAALIDMLIDGGSSLEEATKRVASLMQTHGWALPPQTKHSERSDWERLKKRRERLRSRPRRSDSDDVERAFYEAAKSDIATFQRDDYSTDLILSFYFLKQLAKPKPPKVPF